MVKVVDKRGGAAEDAGKHVEPAARPAYIKTTGKQTCAQCGRRDDHRHEVTWPTWNTVEGKTIPAMPGLTRRERRKRADAD